MTVQNQNVKNVYRGNGSTTVFPFTFAINESHPEYIHVYITNDGGKAVETTDFACDMETRTITYPKVSSSAPKLSATQRLTIYRLLPYEQNLNLVNQGPLFSEDVETQLDDLEMQIQQLSENLVRCFQIGIEAQDFDMTMELEPGKVICVNSDGNGFEAREALMEVNSAWDGEGRQIKGVAEPTDSQDAATKNYVDDELDTAIENLQLLADVVVDSNELQHITDQFNAIDANAAAAAESEDNAAASEANALSYKNAAAASATNASNSASSASTTARALTDIYNEAIASGQIVAPAVDPYLTVEGAAVDAKMTGLQIAATADGKAHFCHLATGAFSGGTILGTAYAAYTTEDIVLPYPITLHINDGYYYRISWKTDSGYTGYSTSRTYDYRLDANVPVRITIFKSNYWSYVSPIELSEQLTFESYEGYLTSQNTLKAEMMKDNKYPLEVFFNYGNFATSTGSYVDYVRSRIATPTAVKFDRDIVLHVDDGYQIGLTFYDNNDNIVWYTGWLYRAIFIPKNTFFKVVIVKRNEEPAEADFDAFYKAVWVDPPSFPTDYALSEDLNTDAMYDLKWERGSFSSGEETPSDQRIRSSWILAGKGTTVIHDYAGNLYQSGCIINFYDLNKKFIESVQIDYDSYIVKSDCYIRLLVTKSPYSPFTDQTDVDNYASAYKVYKTLPSSMVNDVPLTRTEFEQNSYYPVYYRKQMDNNITKLSTLIASAGLDGDNFVFVTDAHWKMSRKKSPMLIRNLVNKLNIDKVLTGGDMVGAADTHAANVKETVDCISAFKSTGATLYVAYGNHDGPTYDPYHTGGELSYPEFYALMQKQADNKMVYNKTDYCFYFDNDACQTRYVFLATGANGEMAQTQYDWIASVLASVPTNYKVIFVAHIIVVGVGKPIELGRDESYYTLSNAMSSVVMPMLDNFNSTHTTEKVVALFTGHTHIDGIFNSPQGIPLIMTDTDCSSTGMTVDGENPNFEAGTITEQCFDTVVVDYGHNVINCVRTGRGRSRKINMQLVEVSTTTTLTTDLEDVTWVSKDEEVATVDSNGVVTAVASGVARITAANDTDMEVWMVRVL